VDQERARALLDGERQRIEQELAALTRSGGAQTDEDFDPGDQATDLYQAELDDSREADLREQLAAVERAEQRLVAGTYGLSTESGVPIPDERLEVKPTAELTVDEERARGRSAP
jgi:DnaK suppressor protein